VVHVGDVERAVRTGLRVHRPEQRIAAEHEFRTGIRVSQLRQPVALHDLRAPNEPAHRLGDEEIAAHVVRQTMTAADVGA
jgi:hypothetical protein